MTPIALEDLVPQPTGRPWSAKSAPKGAATQISELKTLVVGYAKQETIDPLKTLGRYLGFGLVGSLMIGMGLAMLLLALLRGLQQIDQLTDPTWSWVPYLATLFAGLVLVGLFMWRLMKFLNSSSADTAHGAAVAASSSTSTPGGRR